MTVAVEGPVLGQSAACDAVLRALPEWFGIESAVVQYVKDAGEMPAFPAKVDGAVVGLALVDRHFPETA